MAAAAGDRQVVGEAARGRQEDDVGARHHDLTRDTVEQLEDVGEQPPLLLGELGRLPRGEQETKLLLRVRDLVLTDRPDADQAENAVGGVVEQPDRGKHRPVEDVERRRRPQRRAARQPDRDRLRHQLAEDDVEHADGGERGGERDRVEQGGRHAGDTGDERLDQPGEGRFADPAEGDRGEGDAELGRRQIGVEVPEHVRGQPRAALAGLDVRLDLGRAHLRQGELGGDEKAVERDQQEAEQQARPGVEGGVRGRGLGHRSVGGTAQSSGGAAVAPVGSGCAIAIACRGSVRTKTLRGSVRGRRVRLRAPRRWDPGDRSAWFRKPDFPGRCRPIIIMETID